MTDRISIRVPSPYAVTVGRGLLSRCGEWLAAIHPPCTLMLCSDDRVAGLYADRAQASFEAAGFSVRRFTFPHGEAHKNAGTLTALLEYTAECALTRSDLAVALGGGVTGDMTGLAAALYLRGIGYAQIPTSLLAMVDSSVGGKTAVDLSRGKNLIGAFKQPIGVLCDCDLLATLPREELENGLAEAIKTALLGDDRLFAALEKGTEAADWPALVSRCVEIKGEIVAADERDEGPRQLLNLGHTVGHAVELLSGYAVPHGRAVAMGTAVITRAAAPELAPRVEAALTANGLPVRCPYSAGELAEAALRDKKRRGDRITLAIPAAVGDCRLVTVGVEELAPLIERGL